MVMLSFPGLVLSLVLQGSSAPEPRFLEKVRIVSVRASEGEVTFATADGASRTLGEGDVLDEEGGAKLKDVTSASLVFTRRVAGSDGEVGEALIVVRFDGAGKTRVREYRTVGDVSPPRPPQPDRD